MAQVINSNIMSLNAQRNLTSSQGAMATSLERLSSGLRINSAKDDAAGLAISERFSTQIRGMNQAVRNANDGISLSQTAEGALQEVSNNLQRIRELAVQARNATNSDSDRAALDAEVQQRVAEIQRVSEQTEFNGLALLDGSFSEQSFQVGANFGQTIDVSSIAAATSTDLGLRDGTLTDFVAEGVAISGDDLAAGDFTIDGTDIGAVDVTTDFGGAAALAEAINGAGTGVTAAAQAVEVEGGAVSDSADVADLEINGVTVNSTTSDGADAAAAAAILADDINTALAGAGVDYITATVDGDNVVLTAADGQTIEVGGTVANSGLTAEATRGTVELSSTSEFELGGANLARAGMDGVTVAEESRTVDSINVLTAADADDVLRLVDDALTTVNGARADMGAVQNRFESVIANLSTTVENLSASRSRILDADFAAETADLTRAQILQQAGISVLSQANAVPQSVLGLLN